MGGVRGGNSKHLEPNGETAMDGKLMELLKAVRTRIMTPEERETQRVNFAFGNAPDGDNSTIETVKAASTIMKQTEKNK